MLIAHDLGTSGDKASLYDLDGTLVTSVTESYPTAYGPATRSEQDPEHWWRAVVSGTRRLLAASGTAPTAVTGICVGGTMMAVVCLDAAGTVLRPAMIWSDQRAAAQADRLRADVGDDVLVGVEHLVDQADLFRLLRWQALAGVGDLGAGVVDEAVDHLGVDAALGWWGGGGQGGHGFLH